MAYIAHASIGGNGKATGDAAGDQTKKEVCIRTWYPSTWNSVIRIKDAKVRKQFANNMIDIAKNDYVGYDQNGRNTLLTKAIEMEYDFSKIKTKCECDCSSMVTIALLGAIYTILGKAAYEEAYRILVEGSNCATTSTLKARLKKVAVIGVSVYTSKTYVNGTLKAVYGDIYLKSGHVVAYIDNGEKREILKEDGSWGVKTTTRLQQIFETTVDGKISNQNAKYKAKNPGLASATFEWKTSPNGKGSQLIKAMQMWAGMPASKCNGEIDDATIKAFQKKLGTKVDGYVSNPSQMVKALQKWANEQEK